MEPVSSLVTFFLPDFNFRVWKLGDGSCPSSKETISWIIQSHLGETLSVWLEP